jgi:hypothetical protein
MLDTPVSGLLSSREMRMNTRHFPRLVAICVGTGVGLFPAVGVAQRPPAVSAVQIQPSELQVQVGLTTQAFVQAYDRAGNALISVTAFTWRSNKPGTASVDSNGIITGHAPGYALITARYGPARSGVTSDPATVEVLPVGVAPQPQAQASGGAPPMARGRPGSPGCAALARQQPGTGPGDGLFISPQRVKLIKGESAQLQYHTVRGLAGEAAEPACIVFTVDAGRVAQVDSFGLVSSVGDTGHAVLTVTVPGARWAPKQIAVEVSGDSVQFSQRHLSLAPGVVDTLTLVVATDRRALDPAHTSFQYESSDTTKVRVSSVAPVITAVAAGTATIKATSGFYPDLAATVTVHAPLQRLTWTPLDTILVVAMQSTTTLGVRFFAADSTVVPEVPVHWVLPDTTFARFDTATMTLRGIRMGDTRIRVWARADRTDSVSHTWRVRVVAGGLQIATPRLALPVGERRPLAVQLLDDQRRPLGPAADLRWTSTDSTVARVIDGTAVAVSMGHAQLEARTRWDSTVTADVYVVGDLLLTAGKGARWDVYMADRSDLSKARPLSQDSALEAQPVWSPDWRRVAYTMTRSSRSALSDLFVANADGSGAVRLTDDSAMVRSPSFVPPSGDQIVFESSRGPEGSPQLYVIGRSGSGRRQLTRSGPSSHPDASPDGKRVLFVSFRAQNYDVYEMNLDGTGERRLTSDPRPDDSPAYAADGKSFYFLRLEGGRPPTKRVYRQDLVPGAPAVAVTPAGVFVQTFSVSPDGRTLALTVLEPTSDGGGAARVELFEVATQARRPVAIPGLSVLAWPVFRPGGAAAPN